MAFPASPLNTSSRSISLPPRPHPVCPEFDDHLCRLRSSRFTSTPSTSLLIADRLAALRDLYDCVDGLLMLPQNQSTLGRDCQAGWVDGVLDGSLRLLDVCSNARDALLLIKEQVQGIQSVLRRRCGDELSSSLALLLIKEQVQGIQSVLRRRCGDELSSSDEMSEYVGAIKGVKKAVRRSLEEVRSLPKGCRGGEAMPMVEVLREVEGVTSEVLQSLLCYMVGMDANSRKGSWASVSKMILLTMVCEAEEAAARNEFDDADAVIGLAFGPRKRSGFGVPRVESLSSKMVKLEVVIQDFDELLECLFRRLVKTRATLLNILSP